MAGWLMSEWWKRRSNLPPSWAPRCMGGCAVVRLLGGARNFSRHAFAPLRRAFRPCDAGRSLRHEKHRLPSVRANLQHPGALRLDRVYSASASRLVAPGPRVWDGRMNTLAGPQVFINRNSPPSSLPASNSFFHAPTRCAERRCATLRWLSVFTIGDRRSATGAGRLARGDRRETHSASRASRTTCSHRV